MSAEIREEDLRSSRRLIAADDYLHTAGNDLTWNESRYIDFFDGSSALGGWLRTGMRPNEGHAEVSTCVNLPDGRCAFFYSRSPIDHNGLDAGGQSWLVGDPFRRSVVRYRGPALLLEDPWALLDPKSAFATSTRCQVSLELHVSTLGIEAVMGSDQSHIDLIFLPGQADWHYQHLCWTSGAVTVDGQRFDVDGRGGKDHSWGPRNWMAKHYMRWFTAVAEDDSIGFMLMRAVGPTKATRSGHLWMDGALHLVDDFHMANTFADEAPHQLTRTELVIRAGDNVVTAAGQPVSWVPLRHRASGEGGESRPLRIVKSPTRWKFGDGRSGVGMSEMHDLVDNGGVPVGLDD